MDFKGNSIIPTLYMMTISQANFTLPSLMLSLKSQPLYFFHPTYLNCVRPMDTCQRVIGPHLEVACKSNFVY